jgi:hypothetical protein
MDKPRETTLRCEAGCEHIVNLFFSEPPFISIKGKTYLVKIHNPSLHPTLQTFRLVSTKVVAGKLVPSIYQDMDHYGTIKGVEDTYGSR